MLKLFLTNYLTQKMKKTYLFLLITSLFINQNCFAQSGIDFSIVPIDFNYRVDLDGNGNASKVEGNHYGIKLGYFSWIDETWMKKYSLQINNFDKSFDGYTYDNNGNITDGSYNLNVKSYIFRSESMFFSNEIDFKQHIYFKTAFLLGFRNDKISFTKKDPSSVNTNDQFFSFKNVDNAQLIIGGDLGFGYQYNIKHKIGVYAELNVGTRLYEAMTFVNANIGVRCRFK